ncbi:MAG: glycosyltransferase family 4 protein [Desulfomonilaceae bacterium]
MKVAAYFEHEITSGGGFQQGLNAALQMQRICEGLYDFAVYTPIKANLEILADLGLPGIYYSRTISDRVFSRIWFWSIFNLVQARKVMANFEKTLIRDGVDLVYFISPSNEALSLQSLNYIFTVWDLCHLDFPEFPEVSSFGEFEKRERTYLGTLAKAYCVIADSQESKKKIQSCYSVFPERILVIPFQPAPDCSRNPTENDDKQILRHYDLEPGYLFYPAQFWPHKGHIHLLEALAVFRDRNGHCPICVFSGSDTGNLEVVTNFVKEYRLDDLVKFLGFVPSDHIPALYRAAAALVMPTYFGPTNLPPLEALTLGVPVIYPRHLSDQCGDAAIYFDLDNVVSLCDAMEHVLHQFDRSQWLQRRDARLASLTEAILKADVDLSKMLQRFQRRLMCWAKYKQPYS